MMYVACGSQSQAPKSPKTRCPARVQSPYAIGKDFFTYSAGMGEWCLLKILAILTMAKFIYNESSKIACNEI